MSLGFIHVVSNGPPDILRNTRKAAFCVCLCLYQFCNYLPYWIILVFPVVSSIDSLGVFKKDSYNICKWFCYFLFLAFFFGPGEFVVTSRKCFKKWWKPLVFTLMKNMILPLGLRWMFG